jgi:hypothetical protein
MEEVSGGGTPALLPVMRGRIPVFPCAAENIPERRPENPEYAGEHTLP